MSFLLVDDYYSPTLAPFFSISTTIGLYQKWLLKQASKSHVSVNLAFGRLKCNDHHDSKATGSHGHIVSSTASVGCIMRYCHKKNKKANQSTSQ